MKTRSQLLGVEAEGSEKQSGQSLEFSPLPMLRPKGRSCLYESSTVSVSELLSPLALNSSLHQPYRACLHLPSAGIKGRGSQVLGSPLCEFCVSFRQIQSRGLALYFDLQASFIY